MSICSYPFGAMPDGSPVTGWKLVSPGGAVAEVIDLGAATCRVEIPGGPGNLCMEFDYKTNPAYAGVIVGRHAGRIGGARFELNGQEYVLAEVDGPNNHHGGKVGFSHRLWDGQIDGDALVLRYTSPDGEEGFPGTLTVTARYEWADGTTLRLTLDAVCDQDTIASFTHHGYWNLSGEGTVGNHRYQVHAPTFVAGDANNLPTGELPDVEGTPFDFRSPRMLAEGWSGKHPQLIPGCGYDHTFPVPGEGMRELGTLSSATLSMTVSSTLPALHLYTGKETHAALEAQFIPDAIHHPNFPSTVLKAGERWHHVIEYRFALCT